MNSPRTLEQFHRDTISGQDRGFGAAILRAGLSLIEPFYAFATVARNQMFDSGMIVSQKAPRPVISIGNITTGGTGKTPVVRWLADRLHAAGHQPAILMRGYKSAAGQQGDEQRMLSAYLPQIMIEVNPSRIQGAHAVLAKHPQTNLFLLDDGFQHRRLQRDFDLVLIDAGNPFGFSRILPRGLLREPLTGLSRASALLITHLESCDSIGLKGIETILRQHHPLAPIYRCRHAQSSLRTVDGASVESKELAGKKVATFCGIGNPAAFDKQIRTAGANIVDSQWYGDHHHYTPADLTNLRDRAYAADAEVLLTTEKDWVKVAPLIEAVPKLPPIWRCELSIQFEENHEQSLFELISDQVK